MDLRYLANLLRDPSDSEDSWFKMNPSVGGMATEDGRVILNPYSGLSAEQRGVVAQNEAFRLFFRKAGVPQFPLTFQQYRQFRGYGGLEDIRATILARLMSGDPSAGEAAPLQRKLAIESLIKFGRGF